MKTSGFYFRIIHRYLGFFLVGVMSMYAFSGIILTFRDVNWLKKEEKVVKTLEQNIAPYQLGKAIGNDRLQVTKIEGDLIYFKEGNYNSSTGIAEYMVANYPKVLDNMNNIHKAKSSHPLFWLNIFSGIALLFFVISSFWMFTPKSDLFKKGLYFTIVGMIITLILLFI